jgi:hypothetical protein
MFDNLRDLTDETMEYDEPVDSFFDSGGQDVGGGRIFGMTAGQRFFLSIMLLATVTVMGLACLMVFTKVWPY